MGRPRKPLSEASARTKRRRVHEFNKLLNDATDNDPHEQADLLISWLVSPAAKPMLTVLSNSDDAKSLVNAALKSNEFDTQLCSNVRELLTTLGPYSSNKTALLRILSEGIPAKYAAELFDIPARTISAAKSMTDEELQKTLLFVKQRSGKRQRISSIELNLFKEFLLIACPTPSGSKTEKFVQTLPIHDLYEEFLKWRQSLIEAAECVAINEIERELTEINPATNQSIHRFSLDAFNFKI